MFKILLYSNNILYIKMNNSTKWNSNIFRNQTPQNNNKIKKIKRKKEKAIENFETIYDKEEDNISENDYGVDVEEDNIKEGMFEYNEFTGYGWNDPDHKGLGQYLGDGSADLIERIYEKMVYSLNYVANFLVENCDTDNEGKKEPDYERKKKENVKLVRKYIALFLSIIVSFYAVYNWYFITTFKDPNDKKRLPIIEYLIYRKDKETGRRLGLIDEFDKLRLDGGIIGSIAAILYFFFEFTVMFYDDVNTVFLDIIPNTITKIFGRAITFILLFFFLVTVFYYYVGMIKDNLVAVFKGTFLWLSGLIILYSIIKIVSRYSENPSKSYLSNFSYVVEKYAVPSGSFFAPFVIGGFAVLNIIRILIIIGITLATVPIILALTLIFYSFFPILVLGDYSIKDIFKKIDEDCIEDFKTQPKDNCADTFGKIKYFVIFWSKLILGDVLYYTLFTVSILYVFVFAAYDFGNNIQGNSLRNNITNYCYIMVFLVGLIWFKQFGNILVQKLKQAGIYSSDIGSYKFNEKDLEKDQKTGKDPMDKINEKLEELNKMTVENVFSKK